MKVKGRFKRQSDWWNNNNSDKKNLCNEDRLADVASVYLAAFLGYPISFNSFLYYELDPDKEKDYPYYSGELFYTEIKNIILQEMIKFYIRTEYYLINLIALSYFFSQ